MAPNPRQAYPPPAPAPLLDTVRAVETPEGITLHLRPAGPVIRALAWSIDALIRYSLLGLGAVPLAYWGELGLGLWLMALFALEWFYPVLFELYWDGATPGKRALGIKAVHDSGTPLNPASSLIRNLLRAADFLPLLYGFGLVTMLLSRDFQRLGDLAAGTLVIYRERPAIPVRLPPGPLQQPLFSLDPMEQRLIIGFAERSPTLSRERQAELAALLGALGGNGGLQPRDLLAQARWLMGEKT